MSRLPQKSNEIHQLQQYDRNHVVTAFGLINIGSICWFNTLIQTLLSIPKFNIQLTQLYIEPKGKEGPKFYTIPDSVVTKLKDIVNRLNSLKYAHETSGNYPIEDLSGVVKTINNVLKNKFENNYNHSQQCFIEGFDAIIEHLNKLLNVFGDIFKHIYIITTKCNLCNKISSIDNNSSSNYIILYNGGYPTNNEKVPFKIKYADLINRSRYDGIAEKKLVYEFSKMIHKYYTFPEDYKCENCNNVNINNININNINNNGDFNINANIVRENRMRRVNEVIVLAFSPDKYQSWDKSVNSGANYSNGLNIWFPDYIIFPCLNRDIFMQFQLVAQIERIGATTNSGHYYGRFKRNDGIYEINDTSVRKVDKFEPTDNTNAVFYHFSGYI